MFKNSRAYTKQKKLEKKANNTVNEKRIENLMRLELRDKLQKYLLTNDSVEIEIDKKHISLFLGIASEFADDYDYEQVSDTLYIFRAKEIEWF